MCTNLVNQPNNIGKWGGSEADKTTFLSGNGDKVQYIFIL